MAFDAGTDNSSKKQAQRRWKEKNHYERHYCEFCNAWMASDKQSILRHENGGRHKHHTREAEITKRIAAEQQEKEQAILGKSLQAMEAAAIATIQKDYGLFAGTSVVLPIPAPTPRPPPAVVSSRKPQQPEMSKDDWIERKRAREEERRKKYSDETAKRAKITIQPDEGWYSDSDITWMEGIVFGDILEPDMPIQLWRGHVSATANEKRMGNQWQDAIVAAVRARPSATQHADRMVLDVSYLKSGSSDEEVVEKSVSLSNVRIRLGHPMDTRIPPNLEQARLLAMGGEEVEIQQEHQQQETVDEATGFSNWTTVQITRTTTLLEEKQKREEARAREASKRQAEAEAETRRLQEVAHAPDSALGAYDVWGKQGGGYKGVNIERDTKVDATSVSKRLAEGPVAFKKGASKKRSKKNNRRTTSADD